MGRLTRLCWIRRSHHDTVAAVLPLLAAKMAPRRGVLCETEREADLPEQAGTLTLVKQYNYGKIKVSRYERGRGMNVEELLEMMEETLEAGTIVPFSASKRMVDVDRMRDIIDEVRNNLPDEIRESKKS